MLGGYTTFMIPIRFSIELQYCQDEEEQTNRMTHDELTSYGLLKYLLHFKGSKIIHYLDEQEGF